MNFLEKWAEKLEAMHPHVAMVATKADFYACTVINKLSEIADILDDANSRETQRTIFVAPALNTPTPIDVPDGQDYRVTSVTVDIVSSANSAVNFRLQVGDRTIWGNCFNDNANGSVEAKPVDQAVILKSGQEYFVSVDAVPAIVTLVIRASNPRRRRSIKFTGQSPAGGDLATTPVRETERAMLDVATHLPESDPHHLVIPNEIEDDAGIETLDGHTITTPYPPYDG